MSARGKAPVEPLSRAAWQRVEARLFDRLERGEHLVPPEPAPRRTAPPAMRWAVAVAAAAAAAVLLLWWQLGEPTTPLARDRAPAPAELAAPPAARPSTHIATTAAPTRTTFGEATLTLAAQSEVHVAGSDAEGWVVHLDQGEVECEVAPRNGRPPFVVQAGETQVTVVGTRFTVAREGSAARVSVDEGVVQVASGGQLVRVGAGERWPSAAADTQPAPTVEREADVEAPAAAPRAKPTPRRARSSSRPAREAELFARAAKLEATDPDAAIAGYRRLVSGKGRWAANALYAEARLELERGRRERARSLLEQYLARHPSGANTADVRALLRSIASGER